jgi:diguanylate cyclase
MTGLSGIIFLFPKNRRLSRGSTLITLALVIGLLASGVAVLILMKRLRRSHEKQARLERQIAELSQSQEALKTQAFSDHLTGLANRALYADRCQSAIERSKRSKKSFAILMVDLNRFKEINDQYGHAAGDHVLTVVGKRLVDTVRASDTVARYGGDEFVLLIDSIGDRQELTRIGQKLIDMLTQRVTLESGVDVSVGGSIGFAVYPDDGETVEEMLKVADHAMYLCKTSGLMPLF